MRWELALIAPCVLGGCFMARQDARIRPGGQVGVTSAVLYTPDAYTDNAIDGPSPDPAESDASDARGLTEVTIAYGWKRAELRWHIPAAGWNATDDYLHGDWNVELRNPLVLDLELYLQLVHAGAVFAGIGFESARGGYAVVTGELGPDDAISATLRAIYGGEQTSYAHSSDGEVVHSVQLQAQAAYTSKLDAKHDLGVFVSIVTFKGDRDPFPVRDRGGYLGASDVDHVIARTFWMFGASIDWH